MLDFVLVLGHIPGTNIDLTFYELLVLIPSMVISYLYMHRHPLLAKRVVLDSYVGARHFFQAVQNKFPIKSLAR